MNRVIQLLFLCWIILSLPDVCLAQSQNREVTVAHWNIGHFSLGKKDRTTIPFEQADSMAAAYRKVIDKYNADIFGVCEYSGLFTTGGYDASMVLFGDYKYDLVGKTIGYNCNTIFSKFPISEFGHYPYTKGYQGRYAASCTFYIDTIAVKFVETHLDWANPEFRKEQIQELIQLWAEQPYVIICGDFNIKDNTEYISFLEAGYKSFSYGDDITRVTGTGNTDEILVKGFDFISTHRGWKPLLSDHGCITCKLRLIEQE